MAATATLALTAGCGLVNRSDLTRSVWAINESSNHYVVRVVGGATWDLPPNTGGLVMDDNHMLEVLDADNCVIVATDKPTSDVLVNVDAQGRVDFVPQYEQPRLGELQRTTTCGPQASADTTS